MESISKSVRKSGASPTNGRSGMVRGLESRIVGGLVRLDARARRGLRLVRDEEGQGTTEYAILVGVLVVIAIVAIVAFRGRIQELWSSIADSVNGL